MRNSFLAKSVAVALTAGVVAGCNSNDDNTVIDPGPGTDLDQIRIYYQGSLTDASYDATTLYVWNDPTSCNAHTGENAGMGWDDSLAPDGIDSIYGAYWDLDVDGNEASQCINFIVKDGPAQTADLVADFAKMGLNDDFYTREGVDIVMPELVEALPENTARFYFKEDITNETDLVSHIWNEGTCQAYADGTTSWPGIAPSGVSEMYGPYWDVPLSDVQNCFEFIPNNKHLDDSGFQTGNLLFDFAETGQLGNVAFVVRSNGDYVSYEPVYDVESEIITGQANAIFTDEKTLVMSTDGMDSVEIFYSKEATIKVDPITGEVDGADGSFFTDKTGTPDLNNGQWHLSSFNAFEFDYEESGVDIKDALKGQMVAIAKQGDKVLEVSKVQFAKALDAIYASAADTEALGFTLNDDGKASFALWAPTAQEVSLIPYSDEKVAGEPLAMTFDEESGVWKSGETELAHGDFYKFEVTVYHPGADALNTYQVTDPYSLSLSMNSEHSQVVDMNHSDVTPSGWNSLARIEGHGDRSNFVLYEAHVRDFSALDESTSLEHQGKYGAFTETESVPYKHLESLQENGVTHLHLLPIFDIATINDDPEKVSDIDEPFSKLCELDGGVQNDPDFGSYCSSQQTIAEVFEEMTVLDNQENPVVQRLNGHVRNVDSFNWGYDPFHYTVPEGSYSTDPDGLARIKELREMIISVKQDIGLAVVMDIVYNHTNEAGTTSKSVLDKIVPWYYQRLNEFSGNVENSTCCSNTAPENLMFAKLIRESVATWTGEYKIDSFRWDLMGHHPKAQILDTLEAAQAEYEDVYFYGEGWDFGEVTGDRMFTQATQINLYGTGVGTFSDRLRDAVRGGSPFDEKELLRKNQGFGNGNFVYPNDLQDSDTLVGALHQADTVRLGMAGNLRDFEFVDSTGATIKGHELNYGGAPAGYAQDAWEIQNYVSKHDNQTLWDNNAYKIPYEADVEKRTRIQAVSNATVIFGQGMVFSHMGGELLRSKSMQRDSYDSGDWFNVVDFTKNDNNWDVGLPRSDKDGQNYEIIEEVIEGTGDNGVATPEAIAQMDSFYKEMVNIRQSNPQLTIGEGSEIMQRVDFHNTGPDQVPGMIVMSIAGSADEPETLVVINARNDDKVFDGFDATGYTLVSEHLVTGFDSIAGDTSVNEDGLVSIPAWSAAVLTK